MVLAMHQRGVVLMLSHAQPFETTYSAVSQASLSMKFPR